MPVSICSDHQCSRFASVLIAVMRIRLDKLSHHTCMVVTETNANRAETFQPCGCGCLSDYVASARDVRDVLVFGSC